MSDIQKAHHHTHHPRPQPRREQTDDLYTAKGPQNDGGYGIRKEKSDPLFRDDESSSDFGAKGPQNDGGYGVRKDKSSDGVVRKDDKAQVDDPLFTDKVDIKFSSSK